MAVLVQGESSGMVAEVLLYRLYIVARLKRGNSVGVAQIMEPLFGKPSDLQRLFQMAKHNRIVQVFSRFTGEYQVRESVIIPRGPGSDPVLGLSAPLALQYLHHEGRGLDCARLVILQAGEAVFLALDPWPGKLLFNRDRASVEVHA